jgi:NAD-dependent SIR2 family protein deacetylase
VYPAAQFPLDVRQRGGELIEVNLYETELTAYCAVSLRGPSTSVLPELVGRVIQSS